MSVEHELLCLHENHPSLTAKESNFGAFSYFMLMFIQATAFVHDYRYGRLYGEFQFHECLNSFATGLWHFNFSLAFRILPLHTPHSGRTFSYRVMTFFTNFRIVWSSLHVYLHFNRIAHSYETILTLTDQQKTTGNEFETLQQEIEKSTTKLLVHFSSLPFLAIAACILSDITFSFVKKLWRLLPPHSGRTLCYGLMTFLTKLGIVWYSLHVYQFFNRIAHSYETILTLTDQQKMTGNEFETLQLEIEKNTT
ncbi:unnamed protein product [Caenorhabditis sp. 36 PRJEB53466]|nr:unnamed protein product [Caenorhabditis sp. 36 PRJEB53466]